MPMFPMPAMKCSACRAKWYCCCYDHATICDSGRCTCGGELRQVYSPNAWQAVIIAIVALLAPVILLLAVGGVG